MGNQGEGGGILERRHSSCSSFMKYEFIQIYCETYNMRRTLVRNKIVGHTDVVGAAPVGTAPTTSSFSTRPLASMDWAARWVEKHLSFVIWCDLY